MSVAIEKVEGVESVRVSLEEGLGEIVLVPTNTVDPAVFLDVIEDNGFTPGKTEMTVVGALQEEAGRHLLLVTGPNLVYELVEDGVPLPADASPGQTVSARVELVERAPKAGTTGMLRLIDVLWRRPD